MPSVLRRPPQATFAIFIAYGFKLVSIGAVQPPTIIIMSAVAPAFAEYPVAETLETFDRRCIINIELDVGVTRQ